MNEADFRTEIEAQGYTLNERTWEAGVVNDTHTHPFSAKLLCVDGSIELTTPDGTFTCRSGDRIDVDAGVEHREVVGPQGVRLLVGRKEA